MAPRNQYFNAQEKVRVDCLRKEKRLWSAPARRHRHAVSRRLNAAGSEIAALKNEIVALKSTVASLQANVEQLQAAQKAAGDKKPEIKKPDAK